jgi:mono/diheme cytochrome c family protein
MKKFLFGFSFALVVVAVAGLCSAMLGFINTDADRTPGRFEAWLASNALDASMERHAARETNPLPPTDANLIDGMTSYTMACADCHGGLDRKARPFGASLYPPAPQLLLDPPDDPEWHLFYAIKHGVRNTGMPAWKGLMSDKDIWKITAFLSRLEKLPPAVQEQWKKAAGGEPAAATPEGEKKDVAKDKK